MRVEVTTEFKEWLDSLPVRPGGRASSCVSTPRRL